MKRRRFLGRSAMLAANYLLLSSRAFAGQYMLRQPQGLTDAQLNSFLQAWLSAFNANQSSAYRAFIAEYLPEGLPYIDDDLAVRDVSGGLELLRSEITAPNEITGWVKDRSWDRFSRVILTAKDASHLSDIGFRGAPAPAVFSIPRLKEQYVLRMFASKLQTEAQAGRFSGAVLVARKDRVLSRQAFGIADIGHSKPIRPRTQFCIGSMGKMFTAVATLQLVQDSRIRLGDNIAHFLPDYPNTVLAKKVTIEHLLSHTAGTGDIFGPKYDGHSQAFSSPNSFIAIYGARMSISNPDRSGITAIMDTYF